MISTYGFVALISVPKPILQPYKLEGIKALRNVKIKWDFLCAIVKFWDLEDHVFRFNKIGRAHV